MPWPDFSELSFGFAFLREFERQHATKGSFPSAPDFISQNVEARKGYDVSVVDGSTPVFFQFKRSFVLTTRRAKEIFKEEISKTPCFTVCTCVRKNHIGNTLRYEDLKRLETAFFT
jgi:hypothetical protein